MKIRLHFNKQQAAKGLPWTLHTSKGCFSASSVTLYCPTWTEEKPKKKSNPRYFLVADGDILWNGKAACIL